MLPKQEQQDSKKTATEKSKQKPKRRQETNNKNETLTVRENKFDSMQEARMHKEDIAIDKKLSIMPPVPRARPFELVDAICRVCGKKERVNPVLISDTLDRYKCNKCATGAG
jgi:hypothetical protein